MPSASAAGSFEGYSNPATFSFRSQSAMLASRVPSCQTIFSPLVKLLGVDVINWKLFFFARTTTNKQQNNNNSGEKYDEEEAYNLIVSI